MTTILIVDDDPVTAIFLEELLQREGYRVVLAANGREALARLAEKWCDLILMDIHMPELDGYQTTMQIKAREPEERFVPVIFLTAIDNDQELAQCLRCGGDDFLTKPPNPILLKARIHVWLERAEMANQLARDRQDVENVILKMRKDEQFDPRGIRVLMTPLERTNGDLVFSAFRSDGVHHVMLGDFTGHGLVAAICGPMVADLFYRLTDRDLSLKRIISRINRTIFQRLPVGMFLAASFLELDPVSGSVRIWNAAMPSVTLVRAGQMAHRFSSAFPPLGVVRDWSAHEVCEQHVTLLEGDRLYLASDGSVETPSPTGEPFGEERLERFLEALVSSGLALEALLPLLEAYRSGAKPTDDTTLVEVSWPHSHHLACIPASMVKGKPAV